MNNDNGLLINVGNVEGGKLIRFSRKDIEFIFENVEWNWCACRKEFYV